MEQLLKLGSENATKEAVGKAFMTGAERRGTFERGKDFAKTPEGLAAQFDWGAPKSGLGVENGPLKFHNPDDPTEATWMFPQTPKYIKDNAGGTWGAPGYGPHADRLPTDGPIYSIDSGPLTQGSGSGTRAYPTMYGHIRNEKAYNIKDVLSGVNAYRNNYAMSNAIMRDPEMGKRLLVSPEQFQHLNVDEGSFRHAPADWQVGTLQTEGALQTLRRLNSAGTGQSEATRRGLEGIPAALSSYMSPGDLQGVLEAVRSSGSQSARSIGPRAIRRLGIVNDAAQGRNVNPDAFKGLEFRQGGPVRTP